MNEVIEANYAPVKERSLETITAEIVAITQQTQMMILHSAIEVGRRLCEAKEQVHHGEWGKYLAEQVNFSVSTANNFMRIFKEYGDEQIDLFGASKSQTFGNLTYSKAVALFAVPEDEREQFVRENDVESVSVSELKRLIAERDEELTDERRKNALAQSDIEALSRELSSALLELKESTVNEEELENIRQSIQQEAEEKAKAAAKSELDAVRAVAEKEKNKLAEKAAKLQGQLEKADRRAAADIQKAVEAEKAKIAELEKKLEEVKRADSGAIEELRREKERAAELEKKLKASDADSAKFALIFENVQGEFNRLLGLLSKLKGSDPEKGEKLKAAVAAVLANMESRL